MLEIDLSRPVTLAELPRLAGSFFAWWARELEQVLPFAGGRTSDAIVASNGAIAVLPGGVENLAEIDSTRMAPAGRNARVHLWLADAVALRRRVTLSDLSHSDLRKAIALQIDELTPFRPEDAVFDFTVVSRDPVERTCKLDLSVLPRETLAAALTAAAAQGAQIMRIGFLSERGRIDAVDMLAAWREARRAQWTWRPVVMVLLPILATAAVWYATQTSQTLERERIQAAIHSLKDKAAIAATLQRQSDALSKVYAVAAQKSAAPRSVEVLAALTKTLPDSAHLSEFQVDGPTVRITGRSTATGELKAALQKPPFRLVEFESPGDGSRFSGRLQFVGAK